MNTHQIISYNLHFQGVILSAAVQKQLDALGEEEKKQFLAAIDSFLKGGHRARHKIGIDPNVTVLGIKVNHEQRLLGIPIEVNKGEQYLYVTDILLKHKQYDKARSLKLTFREMLNVIHSPSVKRDVEDYKLKKEMANKGIVKPKEKIFSINYLPVQYMDGRCFIFNSEQKKVLDNYTLPLIGLGGARSGKTSLAMSLIYDAISKGYGSWDKPIFYVAESKALVKRIQAEWDAALTPQSSDFNIIFITTKQLVKKYYPNEKIICDSEEGDQSTQEKARRKKPCQYWIKDQINSFLNANDLQNAFNTPNRKILLQPHVIYAEFRKMSGFDTMKDYCKETEGERKSYYTKEQKELLWMLYVTYLSYLSKNNLRHVAFTTLPSDIAAFLVLDELPDNSHNTLKAILKFTKNRNCVLFGDYHQSLFDQHEKQDYLVKTIEELTHLKIIPIDLAHTNKCSGEVVKAINNILDLKFDHDGGYTDGSQYTEVKCLDNDIKGEVGIFSHDCHTEEDKELLLYLKEKVATSPNIVIITLPEFKNEARFMFDNKVLVLTPEEAKGQHFKDVIIYRMLDGKHDQGMLKIADQRIKINKEKRRDNKNHKADRGVVTPILINQIYTAYTRAETNIYLCQKPRHNIEHIYNHLSLAKKINPIKNGILKIEIDQTDWYERFQKIVLNEITGLIQIEGEPQSKNFFLTHKQFFNENDTYESLVEKIKLKYHKEKSRSEASASIKKECIQINDQSTNQKDQNKKCSSTVAYLKEILDHFDQEHVVQLLKKDNIYQLVFDAKVAGKTLITYVEENKFFFNVFAKCLLEKDDNGNPLVFRLLKSKKLAIMNKFQEAFLNKLKGRELILLLNDLLNDDLTCNYYDIRDVVSGHPQLKLNFMLNLETAIKNDCNRIFRILLSEYNLNNQHLIKLANLAAEEGNFTIFQHILNRTDINLKETDLKVIHENALRKGHENIAQDVLMRLEELQKLTIKENEKNKINKKIDNKKLKVTSEATEIITSKSMINNVEKNILQDEFKKNESYFQEKFDQLNLLNVFNRENFLKLLKDPDAEKLFFRKVDFFISNKSKAKPQLKIKNFVDFIAEDKRRVSVFVKCLEELDENGIPYLLRLFQNKVAAEFESDRKLILVPLSSSSSENYYNIFDLALNQSCHELIKAVKNVIFDAFAFSIKDPKKRDLLLHNAIALGKIKVVDCILKTEKYPEPNVYFLVHHAISWAAHRNNTEVLERLLEDPRVILNEFSEGENPLHYAVRVGNLKIIQLLLKKGMNPFEETKQGYNSIHLAISSQNLEIINELLNEVTPLEINHQSQNNEWPLLHCASHYKNITIVTLLLEKGANPNLLNNRNQTALHIAITQSNLEMVNLLLKYGTDPTLLDSENYTALHTALSDSTPEIVELLLNTNKFNAEMFSNSESITPFMTAVMFGAIEEISLICIHFKDQLNMQKKMAKKEFHDFIDISGLKKKLKSKDASQLLDVALFEYCTPLYLAVLRGDLTTVSYLIGCGANPNMDNGKISIYNLADKLAMLSKDKDYLAISAFLKKTKINKKPNEAYNSQNNNTFFIKGLLENNENPNVCNKHQESPLHTAVANKNIDLVNILLEHNADPIALNNDNYTSLHLATRDSSFEIVEKLLKTNKFSAAMFINAKTCSPLMLAVISHSGEKIQLIYNYFKNQINMPTTLSKNEFDLFINNYKLQDKLQNSNVPFLNVSFYENCTPLYFAILSGELLLVKYFIQNGADIYITNGRLSIYNLAANLAANLPTDENYQFIFKYIQTIDLKMKEQNPSRFFATNQMLPSNHENPSSSLHKDKTIP